MAPFTLLSSADAGIVAAAFDLGSVESFRHIPAGTINSNYLLVADGERWFLRVNEGKSEADVRYEAGLVAALADRGVTTPVPRTGRTGQPYAVHAGRFVSLFPWVEGSHREADEVTSGDAAAVGAELARLHRAGAELAQSYPRDGIYTFERICERYRGFADSDDRSLAEAIAVVGDEIAWQTERAPIRREAPVGIIHGDLFRDNVLLDAGGRVAFIDFEQASLGSLVYDLAVCINAWCYTDEIVLGRVQAMVEGYQRVRRLEPAEVAALDVELRRAAMRFTVTRITDVHLPATGQPGKDFRRYLDRLRRWRALDPADLRARLGLG